MQKSYVLDTNILLDNPNAIEVLRNGNENSIYLPFTVLLELRKLKSNQRLYPIVAQVLENLEHCTYVQFLTNYVGYPKYSNDNDRNILDEIIHSNIKEPILVTSDRGLRILAKIENIKTEEFKDSVPYNSESELYTGFIESSDKFISNSYSLIDGKFYFNGQFNKDIPELVEHEHNLWKVKPKNIYQNLAFDLMLKDHVDIVTIQSMAGYGKAQPLDSDIITPSGIVKMGNLKVGDYVISSNGKPTKILAIHPQGLKKVNKVIFNDKSSAKCCDEHLWKIQNNNDRYNKHEWQVLSTKEIKDSGLFRGKGKSKRKQWFIPMTNPVNFDRRDISIDSYLMGVLLGDGCFKGNITISNPDESIIENLKCRLHENYKISKFGSTGIDYSIIQIDRDNDTTNGIINYYKKELIKLNLYNKYSYEKFIPENYKFNSIENRIDLLQGLLDTDGCIESSGILSYSTSSFRLYEDIKFLIESLGGYVQTREKMGKYRDKLGNIKETRISYNIQIHLPKDILPFKSKVKSEKYKLYKKYIPYRAIKDIQDCGFEECQCITVDSEDSTYLTDNFIVTHNSFLSLATALYLVFEKKQYEKIYLIKPTVEIGDSLGYLPGDLDQKVDPHIKYLLNLISKLHNMRGSKCGEIFAPESTLTKPKLNPQKFEILPIQYARGMNIENAVVLIEESQNFSRLEMRAILSRMCDNVKCFITGDVQQTDNPYLNRWNNGLNWVVKKFKGLDNYGHLVLKGSKSRGPITDSVIKTGL